MTPVEPARGTPVDGNADVPGSDAAGPDAASASASASASDGIAASAPIRLLIADDQPLIRRALSMMMQAEPGLEVVAVAADGREAIDLTSLHRPDIVVMDLRMPQVDGVAATREITRRWPGTRVVVLTTFDQDELVFDAIKAGANAYLLKDVEEAEILETIRAVRRGESRLSAAIAQKVLEQFRQMAGGVASGASPFAVSGPAPASGSAAGEAAGDPLGRRLPGVPPGGATSVGYSTGYSAGHSTVSAGADGDGAAGRSDRLEDPLTEKEQRVLNLIAEGLSNKQIANTVFLAEGTIKNYVSRIMDKLHARSRTELAVRAARRDH